MGFLRNKTLRWYRSRLERFIGWCEKRDIELEQVKAPVVREFLLEHRFGSQYTLHGYAQVIKSFLRWCSDEEAFENLVSEQTVRRIELPRLKIKTVSMFTPKEIKALFAACEKEATPELRARDKAILSLLLDAGLRVSEIACDDTRLEEVTGLRLGMVFLKPSESYLEVIGKGGNERTVPLGNQARLALRRHISYYEERPMNSCVFLSRNGNPLSTRSVEDVVYRLAEWAGVKDAHPHRFRHTFACLYLLNGGDIYTLSRIMGHSTVKVTELYLRAIRDIQARKGLSVLDKFNEAGRRNIPT